MAMFKLNQIYMKNLVIILSCVSLLFSGTTFAQNNEGKADDAARISITPQVNDQTIPQGAKNLLLNKMKQICAKNGMSGEGENPFFIMEASIDILSKELTATAPPMHALNMSINFYIKDANGAVFSETSYEAKGVGQNETKAYIAGIKNIKTTSGQFKAMVERGKTKILEFYNSQCDFVISKAKALQKQGNNGEAIKVLKSVPPISKECYDMCMELLGEIEPPVESIAVSSSGDGGDNASSVSSAPGNEVEIENGLYLVYMGGKHLGDKTVLHFELQNQADKDYDIDDYALDTRVIDANGDEFDVIMVETAGKRGNRVHATVINGTPVKMECQFDKLDAVAMFEYKYKGRTYRLKNLPLTGSVASSQGQAAKMGSGSSDAESMGSIAAGSKVYAEVSEDEDFDRHYYVPAKVISVASAATKGEYEVMSMGEGGSENKWTNKLVAKWHMAKKEELKEGLVVLYSTYDINDTRTVYPGIVVAVDELYKNLVSIKGRYSDIQKIEVSKVIIPDSPKIKAP